MIFGKVVQKIGIYMYSALWIWYTFCRSYNMKNQRFSANNCSRQSDSRGDLICVCITILSMVPHCEGQCSGNSHWTQGILNVFTFYFNWTFKMAQGQCKPCINVFSSRRYWVSSGNVQEENHNTKFCWRMECVSCLNWIHFFRIKLL